MEASIVERAIRKNYTKQLHYLQVTAILGMLYEREVIGRLLKERIEAERDPLRKRTLLLDHVSLQPLQVLQTYCAVLEDSARADCLYAHKQIAEGICNDLVKSAVVVTDTEKDSALFGQDGQNCADSQVQITPQTFPPWPTENSRPVLSSSNEQTEQKETEKAFSTASECCTREASLQVVHAPKQDVVHAHHRISMRGSGFTEDITMASCAEQLNFVEHMYGCFDFPPSDKDEHKETDMEEFTECTQQEVVAMSEQKYTGNFTPDVTANRKKEKTTGRSIEYHSTSNPENFTHSHFRLTVAISFLKPSGPLKSKTHRKLVQMLWCLRTSEPEKAKTALDVILMKKGLPLDIKLACLDAGLCSATQNLPRLKKALEECDKAECQNPLILKCRLHLHIASCHLSAYIGVGGLDMRKHIQSAFELSTQISGEHSALRAANTKIWSNYEETKHNLTIERLDEMMAEADRNIKHYHVIPEWTKPISMSTFLVKAFMEIEKAEFHKHHDRTIVQASLKAVQSVLQYVDQMHWNLDMIQKGYYYHLLARLSLLQEDLFRAAEYGQLACNQYIQNFMFQRALQVAGQLHSSELEQQVMQAIKRKGN